MNPEGSRDTLDVLTYPAGFTPKNSSNNYAFNGTLLFDFTPLQFRLSSSYNYARNYDNSIPMLDILNNRSGYDDWESFVISGRMTHLLNPSTYYDLNVNYFSTVGENGDDYFGNDWKKWSDSLAVAQYTNGRVIYGDRWNSPNPYVFNGFVFSRDGSGGGDYRIYKENYWGGSASLVSQINRHHEIKAGIETQYYTLRRFRINSGVMFLTDVYGVNDMTQIPDSLKYSWSRYGSVNNYGYDIFGREVDEGFDGPKHPLLIALYLQDKIEYGDIIINAGLRFDYFDSDRSTLVYPANPQINLETGLLEEGQQESIPPYQQLSPRLGFSFPVTEKTVFYTQYGKFIQMPEDVFTYPGNYYLTRMLLWGGAISSDLQPVRTTAYEVGFRQQISPAAAFDLAGFYRNIKGQVQTDIQQVDPNSEAVDYVKYINGAFSTTKGLEFRFILRRIQRLQVQLNYTLTSADGTDSWAGGERNYSYRDMKSRIIIQPLAYSQTHRGAVNLDYRFLENDGGIILRNSGLNLLISYNSGHPYTHRDPIPGSRNAYTAGMDLNSGVAVDVNVEARNSSKTPWNFNFDIRLDKTINLWKQMDLNFYLRVLNLLNTRNAINVYPVTGDTYDDGFLSNPEFSQSTIEANGGEQYQQMYRAINLTNGQAYWDQWGRQLYDHPRQIFLGLKILY
jgi:hypothetical protein